MKRNEAKRSKAKPNETKRSVMGDDGIAAISAFGADRIEDLHQFQTNLSKPLGQDRLDILERTS